MADDGIDRDAEKRMEFSTSKEVQVAPTFEAMHLKENLLRGYIHTRMASTTYT